MKNKTTIYHLILDKSSSMSDCRGATINGFNSQINTIKELKDTYPDQEFIVSLTIFNQDVDHVIKFRDIGKVQCIGKHNYRPGGMTALLDAIGTSVENINRRFLSEINNQEISVVVVVLTDGYENTSRKFDYPTVSNLIKELESTGQWTFSLVGADIDAFHSAQNLNIRHQNIMAFDKDDMMSAMNDMNQSIRTYASMKSVGVTKTFFLDDIEDRDRRKNKDSK